MIEDLLQEIVALEKEQEAKVRNSVQEAKDIVLRAKEKAVAISDDADAKIKELSSKNIEKAKRIRRNPRPQRTGYRKSVSAAVNMRQCWSGSWSFF